MRSKGDLRVEEPGPVDGREGNPEVVLEGPDVALRLPLADVHPLGEVPGAEPVGDGLELAQLGQQPHHPVALLELGQFAHRHDG